MKKVISYRQKLISLARIYKIDQIFNSNNKLTTYEIELFLLKNNVPIPSRRGYFSHKLINEVFNPFYASLKEQLPKTNSFKKYLKNPFAEINFQFSLKKYLLTKINLKKPFKIFINIINNYFTFIITNITNFFRILFKTTIEALNNIYNFKVKERVLNKFILRGVYASILVIVVSGGFYVKQIINNLDSLKFSLEIKSDKKENVNVLNKKREVVKKQNTIKKNDKKNLLTKTKTKDLVKKNKTKQKPYNPETDYTLNTQTVLNLFEDLEYDLDYVRDNKKVKPIYFTRLPKDLSKIKSVREKKETFLQILLPLVVAENEQIALDRIYLFKILKDNESAEGKKWLSKKYKAYKVNDRNINELIKKMDIIPTSIALAQAAKESGWGTSRFALEGNAIYGQWTWSGDGIEPLEKTKDQNHKILKFPLLRASVKAYINNLNTHRGYKSFRKKRDELRKQNKKLAGLELIHELKNYAQTGVEYTKILEKIIKQNDLDELENVRIDDFKESNQLKL